ncbi:MAG TPA: PQQ-binding-like beta-propeller repeat protein, partial [Acidimicrobiales bacterium]|nr:PQQ-binding-like beta-propeller repeat protein [Acidimicrobiales bacterium]
MRRRWTAALTVVAAGALAQSCSTANGAVTSVDTTGTNGIPAWEWPTYGHDSQHTFHGMTTLTSRSVTTLKPAWEFLTGDAVTVTPTVVNGTVYAGSWDGNFYAIDLETGSLRWKFALNQQHAVTPYPGEVPRDITSDGGLVTSSAWYQPASNGLPAMVIFGGGYTLYALDADDGDLVWEHDYTGRPGLPPEPNTDGTRIFSSPVVVGDKVLFGVDVDGQSDERGYIVAADVRTGNPIWEFQTDVNSQGTVLNDGCGSVWSSGTVLPS